MRLPTFLSLIILLTSQVITSGEANALSTSEINDIFSYFGNKFSAKSSANAATSCTNGILNSDGSCTIPCNLSVTGVSVTQVNPGSSSLTCDVTGYSGTVSYTCTNGTATTTGSCSCASGYTLVSGVCQQQCSVSGVTGLNSTTVNYGSGTLSCNQSNFTGSVSYTCTNGTATTTGSCSCASGYTLVSGVCQQQCSVSGVTGLNSTTVNYGSGTLSCNQSNFTGSVSYTCTNGTATTTGSCSCASGYYLSGSGNCALKTCSVSGANISATVSYSTVTPQAVPCNTGYSSGTTYSGTVLVNPSNCTGSTTSLTPAPSTGCSVVCDATDSNSNCYTYVGEYHPYAAHNTSFCKTPKGGSTTCTLTAQSPSATPAVESCIAGCVSAFGGSSSNYTCSTTSASSINGEGWVSTYGKYCSQAPQNSAVDDGASGYSQTWDSSAWVADLCDANAKNYCFTLSQ